MVTWKDDIFSLAGRRMENQISTNFDRKFYIFDKFAEKQFPYQKRNNFCADRRLKNELTPLPASEKQSNEMHHNLPGYNSFTAVNFIHSFIHSFIPVIQPVIHSLKD